MPDEWSQFPDAGTTATADDPFSKFPDVEQPKAAAPGGLALAIGKILGTAQDVGTEALSSFSPELSQRVFGQTTGSLRPEQIAPPLVSPERAKEFVGELPSWAGGNLPIVQGATESLSSALSSLTAPGTLAQLPAFAVPGVAETFAANVLHDVPKQFEKLGTVVGEHGLFSKEAGAAFGEAGITDLMGLLAGKSGTAGRFRSTAGEIAAAPTTLSENLAPVLGKTATTEPIVRTEQDRLDDEFSARQQRTADLETEFQRRNSLEAPAIAPAAPESVIAPTSPETAAAPITPEGTRIEGPALVDPDGNVIIQGKLGETHADLLKQASEDPDAEKALAAFENDAQHVFVDDQGNVLNREQAAPVGVKAGQLPEGTVKVESQMLKAEPAPVQSFVTSKGSEYTVHEDGTTTRNKSIHPEHPGDEGVKPRSSETFYVTPEQALQLAEVQAQGQKTRLAKTADGEWGMQYTEGPNAGKFERRTVTRPSLKPAVGLQPVEVWYGQNKPHFGNEITEVKTGSTETTSAAEPAADQSTTGIAQRVNEARAEAGRTGEIQPGEGVSAEEMINRGRELLKGGADPEAIISGVSEGKAVTGDEMAVLRARREELSRVSDQASDDLRKNPNDPVLKQAADDAFKAETDFAQRIKPAATEWHKVGEAMQGETAVETGTFTGLRRAFVERTGRDVTPKESVTLEKTAERVKKANTEVDQATSAFSEVVKKETETTLPKSAEELRNHFAEKFKKMLPC